MTTITSSNWSDKLERLAATAVQAFLACFILSDLSTSKTAVIAAGAAVLALVKAWAKEVLDKRAA
jgi:hypothetical protein|tara:strand:+ start:936 stop:1130 length:195 start_codon:yes stop_codon:yes gene_type:complete